MNYKELREEIDEIVIADIKNSGELVDEIMAVIDSYIESKAVEVESIIVDAEGLKEFIGNPVELHTTIGGNAGSRRAAIIIRTKK